jgi:two-component system cell cycle response regulator DivK
MNSRFVYPTNTGSLGQPRRLTSFATSMNQQVSTRVVEAHTPASGIEISAKPTVLVVEDDDDSLFILKSLLKAKGYHVIEAWDGKQARDVAETQNLDLMLLDLQLPGLNGLGVVQQLRESPKHESLPIVVMTGFSPEECRGSAIAAGCDDFLLKPIDFDRLDLILDYYAPLNPPSSS